MDRQLEGKTALVTGGGVGIGRQVVADLAEAGARVAFTYRTHPPEPEFLDQLQERSGAAPVAVELDVTDEGQVVTTVARVCDELGGLDILVNNAGGLLAREQVATMQTSFWEAVLAVNLTSAFVTTREALRSMRDQGRVINVASLAGHNGGSNGSTAYATSKAGMFGFTRGLAKEVAGRGITVNAVAPGLILDTPFHETFTPPEAQATSVSSIALGRGGVPQDVSGPVLWLCSPGSAFVTGAIIDINGGQYLR